MYKFCLVYGTCAINFLMYLFKYCELVCIVLFVGCRSLAGVTVSGVVRKQVGGAPSRAW